jgi:hypothetical protein
MFDLEEAVAVLERTPAALDALLRGLPEAWTRADEGPDSFTPFDVVGHLVDGEETDWMTRARLIRAGGPDARFAPYDRFRHRTRNVGRTLESLLDEFATLRAGNLAELRGWGLAAGDLAREGVHPSFGAVTLEQLLAAWVVHDLGHLAQVSRVMAKRYREAIGPWREFLPVVDDRRGRESAS